MRKLISKIGFGLAGSAFLASTLATGAFATDSCVIKFNGYKSINRCKIVENRIDLKAQINVANVSNFVGVVAGTGGDIDVSKNTADEGNINVTTGEVKVNINITNNVNSNIMK